MIWLEADSTNNDPAVVASCYLNSVCQIAGTPRKFPKPQRMEKMIRSAFFKTFLPII